MLIPLPCIIRILSLVVILKTFSSVRGLLIKLHIIGFHSLNGRDSQVVRSPRGPIATGWSLNYLHTEDWLPFRVLAHVLIPYVMFCVRKGFLSFSRRSMVFNLIFVIS
jgi:hypothetical protein